MALRCVTGRRRAKAAGVNFNCGELDRPQRLGFLLELRARRPGQQGAPPCLSKAEQGSSALYGNREEGTMTRFEQFKEEFEYLHYAEQSRTMLDHIPDEDVREKLIQRHDELVHEFVPFEEFPDRMEDLQPTGTTAQDFAITRYTDGIYLDADRPDHFDPTRPDEWRSQLKLGDDDRRAFEPIQDHKARAELRTAEAAPAPQSLDLSYMNAVQRDQEDHAALRAQTPAI